MTISLFKNHKILPSSLTTKGNPRRLYYKVVIGDDGHWKEHELVSVPWPTPEEEKAIEEHNQGINESEEGIPAPLRSSERKQ